MSNTPRTDAATVTMLRLDGDADVVVDAYFARTLERELIAARSATAAPVAWCVGYDDPRMGRIHSDPTMHKPQAEALAERNGLALVSLYAGSLPVEEEAIGHARYEYLRTLNPRKFAALYNEALMGVHQFDDLVDRYRDASRPSPTTKEQP